MVSYVCKKATKLAMHNNKAFAQNFYEIYMDFFHVLDKPMFQLLSAELVIPEAISSFKYLLKILAKNYKSCVRLLYLFIWRTKKS